MKWLGRLILLIVLVAIIGIAFVAWKRHSADSKDSAESSEIGASVPEEASVPPNPDPRLTNLPDGRVALNEGLAIARSLHSEGEIDADLGKIEQLLEMYQFVFKANPVGSENAEIMAQLMGDNPKKLVFALRQDLPLNEEGALLDRWGTPYYVHPLARDQMDVRSAGPDGKLWTADDASLGLDEEAKVPLKL